MKACYKYIVVISIFMVLIRSAAAVQPMLTLQVKPVLCVRYSSRDLCELTVTVRWQDTAPGSYCLRSNQDVGAIRCWHQLDHARLTESRVLQDDLVYWLSVPGQVHRLVSAKVEMATLIRDHQRRRLGRRHIWNLI